MFDDTLRFIIKETIMFDDDLAIAKCALAIIDGDVTQIPTLITLCEGIECVDFAIIHLGDLDV